MLYCFHDIHEYNVDAVKRFVPDLIAEGFQLVTVPELYGNRGELEAGTVHYRASPTTSRDRDSSGMQIPRRRVRQLQSKSQTSKETLLRENRTYICGLAAPRSQI